MKKGATFINTARGEVVDHTALERAIRDRGIRAGLDVFPGEPAGATADFTTPLTTLPQVYGTHHVGGSTDQAQEAIAAETVRVITSYMGRGPGRVGPRSARGRSRGCAARRHRSPGPACRHPRARARHRSAPRDASRGMGGIQGEVEQVRQR